MPVSHAASVQFPLEAAIISFTDKLDKDPDTKMLVALRMMREFAEMKVRADQNSAETSYAYDSKAEVRDWASWMEPDLKKLGLSGVQVTQAVDALTNAALKQIGTGRDHYDIEL